MLFDILNLMGPKFAQFDSAVAGASSEEGYLVTKKTILLALYNFIFAEKCGCLKEHYQGLF